MISQNLRDLFAKRQGAARVAGRAGHVASREWRVHGGGCGPGLRALVHRSTVDQGGAGVRARPGGRAAAAAPLLAPASSPWGRCRARRGVAKALACRAGRGERGVRAGRAREWPRRTGRAVGRLDGGRRTPASPCTRKVERERAGRARAWSSPRCGVRAVVFVAGDGEETKIDGGGTSAPRLWRRQGRDWGLGRRGSFPRVPRGGAGL